MEFLGPVGRRGQKVRDGVGDFGLGETFLRGADCGLGNVEGGGLEAPGGELFRVVAETAADNERWPIDFLRMVAPEIEEMRIGGKVGPGDDGGAGFGFAVEGFEPAGGVS